MQQDFAKRISIVINRELPAWQVMNTLAHISAYFGHFLTENFVTAQYFTTKDNVSIPRNTQYPIIVFGTDGESLSNYAKQIRQEEGIEKMFFVREMIETSDDDEIQQYLSKKDFLQIEFLGVGIFGDNAQLKMLTKGFKLWS